MSRERASTAPTEANSTPGRGRPTSATSSARRPDELVIKPVTDGTVEVNSLDASPVLPCPTGTSALDNDPLLPAGVTRCSVAEIARIPVRSPSPVSGREFSIAKKWWVLVVTFIVQVSMNYNAAIYGFAYGGIQTEFGVSSARAHTGQWLFLIAYAFGCELWAPFSEEFGRKPIMQASLWLVNLFALIAGLAPNDTTIYVARFFGGLSSAGGSVTLGIVADMYGPWVHQYALGFIVLSSCGGSVIGPLVGGPISEFANWRWIFWTQVIFGCFTALLHFFSPETDANVLATRRARKLRKYGGHEICGPNEFLVGRFHWKRLLRIMSRPFIMLATEPIVFFLSLLSGFSDALIFTCLESFGMVLEQWNFSGSQIGFAFASLLIGYLIAYGLHCYDFKLQRAQIARLAERGLRPDPERRLKSLLFLGPLLPIGLFLFGGFSYGPGSGQPWIAPMIAAAIIGIANIAIYMATIDYMVAAYGRRFAASATGGNGFCRDFLAGISAFYARPLYENLGPDLKLQKGSWLLGGLAIALVIPVFMVYYKGTWVRSRSKMAEGLNEDDAEESFVEKRRSRP